MIYNVIGTQLTADFLYTKTYNKKKNKDQRS